MAGLDACSRRHEGHSSERSGQPILSALQPRSDRRAAAGQPKPSSRSCVLPLPLAVLACGTDLLLQVQWPAQWRPNRAESRKSKAPHGAGRAVPAAQREGSRAQHWVAQLLCYTACWRQRRAPFARCAIGICQRASLPAKAAADTARAESAAPVRTRATHRSLRASSVVCCSLVWGPWVVCWLR